MNEKSERSSREDSSNTENHMDREQVREPTCNNSRARVIDFEKMKIDIGHE